MHLRYCAPFPDKLREYRQALKGPHHGLVGEKWQVWRSKCEIHGQAGSCEGLCPAGLDFTPDPQL
jgi:hypothetical protein